MSNDWSLPSEVEDLEIAFGGADVMSRLMPSWTSIPDEFKQFHNPWAKVQQDWFFSGLKNVKWKPRKGIDTAAALRHIKAIQGSWEPKHEHKEAAVAYLLSLWFESVTYDKAEAKR